MRLPVFACVAATLFALPALAQSSIKIASVAPEGSPWADGILQFKAKIEKASGGKVLVLPKLGGILGDENETVVAVQRGQIPAVGASTGALASVVPELTVLELPYLFRSAAEADYILDKVILSTMEKKFQDRGLVLGFWSENGYRSFGTKFGFIKKPEDLKGHPMRAQENPVHLAMYQAFGGSPVPIPTTEVLTSLQKGVVDGYDNTPLYAMAANWLDFTKFFTVTDHIYQPAAIVFNKGFFDGLPTDVQAQILSSRTDLAPGMRVSIRNTSEELLKAMTELGVQLHRLTPAERAVFEAKAKEAQTAYMAKASGGEKAVYQQIVEGLARFRSGKP